MSEESPEAARRRHHYVFAHRALPRIFLGTPGALIHHLAIEEPEAFLRALWERVGEDVALGASLSPAGLQVELVRHGQDYVAVVTLPTPREMAEAHMVAMVLRTRDGEVYVEPPEGQAAAQPPVEQKALYYTLEHGLQVDFQTPRTVLCRWDEGGAHLNYGDGPPAQIGPFLEAIFARLEQDAPW